VARTPVAGALLLASAVMIAGGPPFALFFSELVILQAGFLGPHRIVTSFLLASLVVVFCGVLFQVGRLVLGKSSPDRSRPVEAESLDLALGTTLAAAVVAVVSAVYLPAWLIALLQAALRVVEAGA
jgi:hydrogenase-4 component F